MLTKGKKDLIIVPYDFTVQSETALHHASKIGLQGEDEVKLLHIVNSDTAGRLKKMGKTSIEEALKEVAEKNQQASGVKTTYHAEEGSIFTTIGSYLDSSGASLAVMGTHGVHGFQHIVGANALKVISSSTVPFVIVQKRKIDPDGYKKIVVPVDGNIKGKNKITTAIDLAKYFKSTIYIFEANTTDAFVQNRINVNLKMIEDFIKEHSIPFFHVKEEGKGSFAKQLIKYAAHIDGDLIVISSHSDNEGLMDYIFGNDEVQVLNNDPQIAVLCVNPVSTSTSDVTI
jgi:nucleotide-binding universal stress UspA family protein